MKARKETHARKRKWFSYRLLIGTLFSIIIISGSFGVAYADGNISSMMTNWFNKLTSESVESVDQAIDKKREEQTKRLKKELRLAITQADEELQNYTDNEIDEQTAVIQSHTDTLIRNIDIDNTAERKKVENKLNKISNKAILKMNKVMNKNKTNNKETSDKTADKEENKDIKDKDEEDNQLVKDVDDEQEDE